LKKEHEQKVKQVGRQAKDLPKGEARFHGFHHSDQSQIRFQSFPFVFPDGEG
jgi:hypothetical protein